MIKNAYPSIKTLTSGLSFLLMEGRWLSFEIIELFNGRIYPTWHIASERAEHRLHLVREGCIEYTPANRKGLRMDAGSVIWIAPGVHFTARPVSGICQLCALRFVMKDGIKPVLPCEWWAGSFDQNEWLYAWLNLERLVNAAKNDPSGAMEAAISSGLHVLFAMLYESISHRAEKGMFTPGVLRVRRHLDTCPEEPLDMNRIAQIAGLNSNYIARLFKDQTGLTIRHYHLAARMRYAQALLSEGLMNITEISHSLGYSEPAAFSRAFKQFQGQPPSDFSK